MTPPVLGVEVTGPVLLLGATAGMTYGLLAVGLVLIYRSSRIINFAHGAIGAFGATLLGLAVVQWGVPYWVAFPIVLLAAGAIGGLAEVVVIRRLRGVPGVMSIVATLGLSQFLLLFASALNGRVNRGSSFPQPAGLPRFEVGPLLVTPAYSGMLIMTPLLVAALALFLRRSRFGLWMRAAAANPDAARMAGVPAARMSTLAWALGGGMAAFTASLVLPATGYISSEFLGPGLLLRALTAAVVARMQSLPIALAAGIAIGVLENIVVWNVRTGGATDAALFVVIVATLLLRPSRGSREEEKGSWAAVQAWPALPEALRASRIGRHVGWLVAGAVFVVALLLPLVTSNASSVNLVALLAFTLVGLSVGMVMGLGGQLSLGQFAVAGVGAFASYKVVAGTGNFLLAFVAAGVAGAVASLVIGLPALRIRGLMLTVTTLGFALAAGSWMFQQPWMFGEGVRPGQPIFGGFALDTGRRYYLFAVGVTAIGFWVARNAWTGGIARRLRAVRDNEDAARAFALPVTLVKLQGFAVAGFLAGLGGATFSHQLARVTPTAFPISASVDVVAMSVLGGIGILAGPLIGALYIIGVPKFLPLDSAGLAASQLGWLILILYSPGGIAQLLRPLRDRVARWLARTGTTSSMDEVPDEGSVSAGRVSLMARAPRVPILADDVILGVEGITKRYGGLAAVDGVSLRVQRGETLGIIGPNGAGKTTLFELIGGFARPDAGTVTFAGTDVTHTSAERRADLGLVRSFQDAALFPTMTVLDVLSVALERCDPTSFWMSMAGIRRSERRQRERARELVGLMGLTEHQHKAVGELSTGTRRIAELACIVALEPQLILLDEPSSGIAQRETEALGDVLLRLKHHLGATMIVIEHDMPLIMGLSGRMIAMESGRVLAEGTPAHIRTHPGVIESYLGGDPRTVARSGAQSGEAPT